MRYACRAYGFRCSIGVSVVTTVQGVGSVRASSSQSIKDGIHESSRNKAKANRRVQVMIVMQIVVGRPRC